MADVFEQVNNFAGRSSGSGRTQSQIRSVISAAESVCGLNEGEILRETSRLLRLLEFLEPGRSPCT